MTSIENGGIHPDKRKWEKLDSPKAPPERANAKDGVGKELEDFKRDLQRFEKN